MSQKWLFISNTFLLLAKRSKKRFYKFMYLFMQSIYTQHSVTELAAIYDALLPFFNTFKNDYKKVKANLGVRHGDVYAQKRTFNELVQDKMYLWHINIMNIYGPKTVEYKKIFYDGLTPLSTGTLEERIIYFDAIIINMGTYESLDTITDEMITYSEDIQEVRNAREQAGTNVRNILSARRTSAEKLAIEMYGSYGLLIHFYRNNPEKILDYIKVSLLQNPSKPQEDPNPVYEITLAPLETKEAGFAFLLTETLMIYVSGNTTLRFYFVRELTDPIPTSYFDMDAEAVKEFAINEYANVNDRFLMIQNLSETEAGMVEIEKV